MTSPLTARCMSVTSSGRSSTSTTIRWHSGLLVVIALAIACRIVVLPAFGGRHDQAALALADRRDDVDDARGQVGRARSRAAAAPSGSSGVSFVELQALAGGLGVGAVDGVDAHHRVELLLALALAGLAHLADDRVAAAQAVLADHRQRHVDVVGAGQVAGGAHERVVVEHVEDAGDRHEDVVLEDRGVGLVAATGRPAGRGAHGRGRGGGGCGGRRPRRRRRRRAGLPLLAAPAGRGRPAGWPCWSPCCCRPAGRCCWSCCSACCPCFSAGLCRSCLSGCPASGPACWSCWSSCFWSLLVVAGRSGRWSSAGSAARLALRAGRSRLVVGSVASAGPRSASASASALGSARRPASRRSAAAGPLGAPASVAEAASAFGASRQPERGLGPAARRLGGLDGLDQLGLLHRRRRRRRPGRRPST